MRSTLQPTTRDRHELVFADKPTDRRFKDLTGQTFGRLTVLGYAGKTSQSRYSAQWWCECECGVIKPVGPRALKRGTTKSCGCLNREVASARKLLDVTGERFGMLTAIRSVGPKGNAGHTHWFCECECGGTSEVDIANLRSGTTKSCGCNVRGVITHGMAGTPEYHSYAHAKGRCQNPKDRKYPDYGARGIEFRFESFEDFYAELGDRTTPDCSIDRIDNDGHYEPGNVRWATATEQAQNTRRNRHITHQGRTMIMTDWATEVGISVGTIWYRINNGWCTSCALTVPTGQGSCTHRRD